MITEFINLVLCRILKPQRQHWKVAGAVQKNKYSFLIFHLVVFSSNKRIQVSFFPQEKDIFYILIN